MEINDPTEQLRLRFSEISFIKQSTKDDILTLWLGPDVAASSAGVLRYLIIAYWILALNVVPYYILLGMGRIQEARNESGQAAGTMDQLVALRPRDVELLLQAGYDGFLSGEWIDRCWDRSGQSACPELWRF